MKKLVLFLFLLVGLLANTSLMAQNLQLVFPKDFQTIAPNQSTLRSVQANRLPNASIFYTASPETMQDFEVTPTYPPVLNQNTTLETPPNASNLPEGLQIFDQNSAYVKAANRRLQQMQQAPSP